MSWPISLIIYRGNTEYICKLRSFGDNYLCNLISIINRRNVALLVICIPSFNDWLYPLHCYIPSTWEEGDSIGPPNVYANFCQVQDGHCAGGGH